MTPPPGEAGYATIAAIAAIAVLAISALTLVESSRTSIAAVAAEVEQARAAAAAEAGLAIALNALLVDNRAERWSIDGRIRTLAFAGSRLEITVEDERGKVPLNLLDDEYAARLVEAAGINDGPRARIAADSLADWLDDDDEPRPDGAESEWYGRRGIRPRNGGLQSVGELAQIRGWDKATVQRIRPFVTVNFGNGGFDPQFAHPDAIAVMSEGGAGSPAAIQRRRELGGQREAIELGDRLDLVGRPLSVVVEAQRPGGARSRRRSIVELTGARERPYLIRAIE